MDPVPAMVEGTWLGKGMGLGRPHSLQPLPSGAIELGRWQDSGLTGPIPTDGQTEELLHRPRGLRHGYSWPVPRHRPPWHQQPVPDEVGCGEGRLMVGVVNHKSRALRVSLGSLASVLRWTTVKEQCQTGQTSSCCLLTWFMLCFLSK